VALRAVAKYLDIPVEQTMGVGDNLNDLPMLEMAGFSVAVANSSPVVKEKAGFVTEGAVGDGVVEAITRFILQ
jgi:hydroxymethylpyrimidine pyrophosphatase-like HAD family hydrolase